MALTATQISDLNNSMSAAQNISLGTIISKVPQGVGADYKIARGTITPDADTKTIATGLTTVVAVVASLKDNPVATHSFVSASIGDQAGTPAAGSFILKSWKPTSTSNPILIAATTPWVAVDWIAIGT